MIRTVLAVLVLVLGSLGQPAPSATAARLDSKEQQLEKLYADYWRLQYNLALGVPEISTQSVQGQIRALVSDDRFLGELKRTKFDDPLLTKRQQLFLNEAIYTKITNDPSLAPLVEQIAYDDNEIRFKVGDKELTRGQLSDVLAHSPDRTLREAAWRAKSQATAVNGPRLRKAMALRNDLALEYSDEIFSMFMLKRKGLDVQEMFVWFEQIKEQTELEYQALLGRMRKELGVTTIEPWDLEFYFSRLTAGFEAEKFPAEEGWAKAKLAAARLGYNLESVETNVGDVGFTGAAYPILYGKEVKILANKYSGLYFYDRIFHAAGHALHYKLMDEPSFLLRANYPEPMDEGVAGVFTMQLYRSDVESSVFGMTPDQVRVMKYIHRMKLLFELRNTMADSLSEFEAYSDTDHDPSEAYNRIHAQYLGVDMHKEPVWAFNSLYGSDPIYFQSSVVGQIIAFQIADKTDRKYGKTWGKEAGEFLKARFFSHGAGMSIDESMREGTGSALTPRYLIRFLVGSMPLQ